MGRRRTPLAQRFAAKVNYGRPNECWLWQGSKNNTGYGQIRDDGQRTILAHRAAYQLTYKQEIPEGLCCLHKCNTPLCMNPTHLVLGTQMDNMRHKVMLDRQARGEDHGSARMTEEIVLELRALYATGKYTYQELQGMYGFAYGTVWNAINRVSWRHVA